MCVRLLSTPNVGDNDGDMSETLSVTFHTERKIEAWGLEFEGMMSSE